MADQGATTPAGIISKTSTTTPDQDSLLDLANTPPATRPTTQRRDPDHAGTGTTRCRVDISAMTAEERLEVANTLPITRNMISTQAAWPASGGVTDMEEYCRALEAVGATFYSDPTQDEGTRIVMEDIRGYEAQLKAEAEREREKEKGSAEQDPDSTQQPSSQ
ncbi:hypothetical protein BJY01DRAFT_255382 [Aspergillus pseudoustus]|uniref:Uncharacterized protein n=1 Tax=Aspergillus pseudoustus TaxID=1810923 RepID=A0ABR4IN91_9EURO